MTVVKISPKDQFEEKKVNPKKRVEKKMGQEHGAVIENNQANYPKTGNWKTSYPIADEKCVACGVCSTNCPEGVMKISKQDGKGRVDIDLDYCKGCGLCGEVCPVGAIKMKQYK